MMKKFLLSAILWLALPAFAQQPLSSLAPQERASRAARDLDAVNRYRHGLEEVLRYIQSRPEIFAPAAAAQPRLLPAEDRVAIRRMWQRVLDYYLALDSARRYHSGFLALKDRAERERSFRVAYAAYVAGYSKALSLIAALKQTPGIDHLLNESMPELGLPAASYDQFKFRFLNVARATEFAALEAVRRSYLKEESGAAAPIAQDAAAIWQAGKGQGEAMTVANGISLVRKMAHAAWFPAQAGVAEWMGDVKVYRPKRSLISAEQIAALPARMAPGDILLTRREWYLSNIGLPGFWPHAGLYIGTLEERLAYFDDPAVQAWVRSQGEPSGNLEQLLRGRHPKAYETSLVAQHDKPPRVIEAISEGVSFTTIEHAADADSLAVLRPRRAKVEAAMALLRAFAYAGRPYDFDFDFRTDAALVCTELVYKAYEPAAGMSGLRFPLVEVMGRVATPANEIVRQFDAQFGSGEQQTDLVIFLDGQEKKRQALAASLDEFRQSWRRPKWHVVVQEAPLAISAGQDAHKK